MKVFCLFAVLLLAVETVDGVAVKETCGTPTPTCDPGLTCEGTKCKALIGSTCTSASTDECVAGASACPTAAKCACPATHAASSDNTKCLALVKQACPAGTDCNTGLTCESNTCKAKVGSSCTANSNDECVTGAMCSTTTCECSSDKTANAEKTMCSGGQGLVASLLLMLTTIFVTSRLL